MNAYLSFTGVELWHIAGWTMIHFLWLGALVGVIAALCRIALRRTSPNIRYTAALVCLTVLAALPIGIGMWLFDDVRALREAHLPETRGEFVATVEQIGSADGGAQPIIELSDPSTTSLAAGAGAADEVAVAPKPKPESTPGPLPVTTEISLAALESFVPYLPWLWIIGTPLTFALLAAGFVGTKRLRRVSSAMDDPRIADLLARLAASLRIGKRVSVAVCERIASPVLVGIVRPIILLPPAALTGWSPDEIEMVLLHELAHVRRWDNLVNLIQRLIESLLFFHPAVWLVSNWIRREREACCDAIVVGRTQRPHAYAELLVALAAQMPRSVLFHPAASSAMAAGPLRKRIRRILQLDDDSMLISGKSFALMLASLLVAATLAVLYLPTIGQAEESTTEVTESAEAEESVAELNDAAAELSEAGTKLDEAADELSADELELDSPDGRTVIEADEGRVKIHQSTSKDDWPAGYVFASPRDGEISASAWQRLYLKLVPATPEELKAAGASHGVRVLNAIPELQVPNGKLPIILTKVNDVSLKSFDDILKVHEDLNDSTEHFVTCTFMSNGTTIELKQERNEAVQPIAAGEPVTWPTATGRATPSAASNKFPPLEDQKLADVAWKRLQFELESIDDKNLRRVQALGYDGGVQVTATGGDRVEIGTGDILVGLHVWPTTSLKDVADVLNRDDLAELNPLKFYVVRRVVEHVRQPGESGRPGPITQEENDTIVTGRISVRVEGQPGLGQAERRASAPAANANPYSAPLKRPAPAVSDADVPRYVLPSPEDEAAGSKSPPVIPGIEAQSDLNKRRATRQAVPLPGATGNKDALRYDGKTFDEWRDLWKNELSTEKRIEAVKALAAFGAHGYEREAAEAILDVAGSYDFDSSVPANSPEGALRKEIVESLVFERRVDPKIWFPMIIERFQNDAQKWQPLLVRLLTSLHSADPSLVAPIKDLTEHAEPRLRAAALQALSRIDREAFQSRLGPALKDPDSDNINRTLTLLYMQQLAAGDEVLPPELMPLLFHSNDNIQRNARRVLKAMAEQNAKPIVEHLLSVLDDETRKTDHLAAVRAMGMIGPAAVAAQPRLERILHETDDLRLRVAATFAIDHIEGGVRFRNQLMSDSNNARDEKVKTQITQLINAEASEYQD